jgi:PTH1 family peptidyl-tRNA hydrolase
MHIVPKALIGLGNPGTKFKNNRHNIGFLVLDNLVERYSESWQEKTVMHSATIRIGENKVVLVKPQTFMNDSGKVVPLLRKQGITCEDIVVVHDELELPFGKIKTKVGGSAKGHNGLRSIISQCGADFGRVRFGIGRPEDRAQVANYVLSNFNEDYQQLESLIDQAADMIINLFD